MKADVVVVDPPRKGLNADAIEALARFNPRRIVYVSCDPATLGRDVALLKEKGYAVKTTISRSLRMLNSPYARRIKKNQSRRH